MKRKTLWTWARRLGLVFLAFFLTISIWQAPIVKPTVKANEKIYGVWITNFATALSYYTTRLDEVTANLAKHHINTIYPAVWNRGATLHPSQVVQAAGGPIRNHLTSFPWLPWQNTLGSFIHHAHRQHLRILPWFEYGLWVPANSAIAQTHPDWLLTTSEGNITATPPTELSQSTEQREQWQAQIIASQAWLNPAHPEVQNFITDLILEVVTQYDVDGIQLDDHFCIPVAFGYDDYTVQKYQASHQGQSPPRDSSDPEWVAWRANQLTQLMAKISNKVRSHNPDLIISLSPSPPSFAYNKYLQDWPRWVKLGLVDEVLVQVYRDRTEYIQNELAREDFADLRHTVPIGIGLYTGPMLDPKAMKQIQAEVETVREMGYEHLSFFSWETTFWVLKQDPSSIVHQKFDSLFGSRQDHAHK